MENRAHLLEVALSLFADLGYDAVGVQSICEAAGVTKPTLYHYFGSKRGLFEALVSEKAKDLIDMVEAAATYKHDVKNAISALVRGYFSFAEHNPTFYRMLLSMWFSPPSSEYSPVIRDLLDRQTRCLEDLFQRAAEDHGNMRGRHRQYAVSLKGLIDTYIGLSLQGYVSLNATEFQVRIVHQFMHGIFS